MGHFMETDGLTKLPVYPGDDVHLFIGYYDEGDEGKKALNPLLVMETWEPRDWAARIEVIRGEYDSYGWLENVERISEESGTSFETVFFRHSTVLWARRLYVSRKDDLSDYWRKKELEDRTELRDSMSEWARELGDLYWNHGRNAANYAIDMYCRKDPGKFGADHMEFFSMFRKGLSPRDVYWSVLNHLAGHVYRKVIVPVFYAAKACRTSIWPNPYGDQEGFNITENRKLAKFTLGQAEAIIKERRKRLK